MPSRQDYQEALQAPEIAFSDPELRAASPVCDNKLGLPRALSGQNATVFQMRTSTRTWAVKCFLHESPDQQQRYAAISAHLERARLPYTVGFQFLSRGVNVAGSWHPVLKMEWVEGDSLKAWIDGNLRNPAALRDLADRFLEMVRKLQATGMAHGDLQHGNLLVCGRELRLVDYDGMFVPALAGLPSVELGHRNYQHPYRAGTDFDKTLDNFSAWVIFLSLYALSIAPDLWDGSGEHDECLLFRKKDFEAPYASHVIQVLAAAKDPTLQQLALRFQVLLYSAPAEAVLPEVSRVQPTGGAGTTAGGEWLKDHRQPTSARPGPQAAPRPPAPAADASWVLGWIKKPSRPAAFRNSVTTERLTAGASMVSGAALVLARDTILVDGYLPACLLAVLLANLAVLKKRYEAEPDVGRLTELSEQTTLIDRQVWLRVHSVDNTAKQKAQRERKGADEIARLGNEESVLRTREVEEIGQIYATRDRRLQELASKRAKLDLEEAQQVARIREPIQAKLKALDQKLGGLRIAEADELGSVLKQLQASFVLNDLRGHSIERASISGIGPKIKENLILAGVSSALEVEYHRVIRVERIGPQLASALIAWRKDVERFAANRMPKSLDRATEAAIKNRYASQVQAVTTERNLESAALPLQERATRSLYASARADIPKEEDGAKQAADANVRSAHGRYAVQYSRLVEAVRSIEASTAEQIDEIEPRLMKLQKDLASLRWRKETLRLQKEEMVAVSFPRYLRRVFLGA